MEASLGVGLLSFLAEIPDPRSRHGRRHRLSAILALVCGAIMSGARSYAAIGPWGQDQDITLLITESNPKLLETFADVTLTIERGDIESRG